MIYRTLEFLRSNVNQYIQGQNPDPDDPGTTSAEDLVTLGEVSLIDPSNNGSGNETIYMSLVYTEEESALKNSSPYFTRGTSIEMKNPPVFLNLGIVFCANFTSNYATALQRLSEVISYFQSKTVFNFSSAPVPETSPFILTADQRNDLEVKVEMMKLSLEEINHLWSILRVRVMPFVMYKVRIVQLEASRKFAGGGTIKEIDMTIQ